MNQDQARASSKGPRVGAGIIVALAGFGLAFAALVAGIGLSTAQAQTKTLPGSGAVDGSVPPYVTAASQGQVTPPDIEDIEHMCALLSSCPDLPFPAVPTSVPQCVSQFASELSSPNAVKFSLIVRECGLRANSCGELRACALRGAKADACVGRGKNGSIDICDLDGRALTCSHEKVVSVRDCTRGGEQCVIRQGQAACVLGPCSGENKDGSPPTCSASGLRILQCQQGQLTSVDCAVFGLKCTTENGKAGCAPPTAACTDGVKRCDGNVSIGCLHGHEVRVDCGAAGLTCNSNGGGGAQVGACVEPPAQASDKCDPKDAAKCDGATIRYCFAGHKRSYFCKSLGFSKCVSEGRTSVRCQ